MSHGAQVTFKVKHQSNKQQNTSMSNTMSWFKKGRNNLNLKRTKTNLERREKPTIKTVWELI